MTNDEIKQFYREIADVCRKYKMSGLSGVWFSGEGHDEYGQIKFWDITDSKMKTVVEALSEKYEYWARHTLGDIGRKIGEIREVHGGGSEEKN